MFFSSIKQINRLISKGMSNIYLRVTNEKKWCTQKFYFLSSKSSSLGQYLGSSNSHRYRWICKLLVTNWKTEVWEQTVYGFSINLILKGIMTFLKSKSPYFLLTKKWKPISTCGVLNKLPRIHVKKHYFMHFITWF